MKEDHRMDPPPSEQTALTAFYDGWQQHQTSLTTALAPLTPAQLALRAAADLRSIDTLVRHIIGARARWLHNALGEGGDDLAAYGAWDRPEAPARPAAELVGGLQATWAVLRACLDRWTAADLAHSFTLTRGNQTGTLSRQWIIWHLIEHDLHHGGELSYVLGMHGIAALDL